MESIKCTVNGCSCLCYSPSESQLRICGSCQHGWVVHAMDKIGQRSSSSQMTLSVGSVLQQNVTSADPSQANCLFDVASLILFGAEAIPTRLKILLDRLFLHLQRDLVLQVLGSFGWSYEEYCRGYRIQDNSGHVLSKWTMATSEEELVILDQFQRFTETKTIAEEWLTNGQRKGKIPPSYSHPLESQGSATPIDVKQLLLNGTVSRASDAEAARHLFGSGAYLSSLLPRYPSLYNPFLAGPGMPGSVGPLSQASVLPYLLARSPLRSLPKPMDFRMEAVECIRNNSNSTSQGSPAKRNGKVVHDMGTLNCGKEAKIVKLESTEDRNSFSSNETNFQSTDEDEPIDYSKKDDRTVPDLSKTLSSVTNPRNPSVTGSPEENQSTTVTLADQEQKQQPRKSSSSNLAKKPYQPTPGYGGTLISPNGKKRVLCTACLKTFCDKGALKIHYSAVHLKELHMCTIDGCTMTFSSRRSRNRHSANPNPKLHFGQTGRRRLHNNGLTVSPFKEGHETLCSSPPPSPNSRDESPSASDGEFQLCTRSDESEGRVEGCNVGSITRPRPEHEESGSRSFEELDGQRDNEGPDESQEVNTEDEDKMKEDETSQEPPRFFQGTSKRKSAIPTRCSIPPTEDSASDFQVPDLELSENEKRRLLNHLVDAASDDSQKSDEPYQMALEKRATGNGKALEVGNTSGPAEERPKEQSIQLSTESLSFSNDEEIVDLSRPSLARSVSNQSSEMSVEHTEATMRNGKPFISELERQRDPGDRYSACSCCQLDSVNKGIEGFPRHFQLGPADPRHDQHSHRSVHVCKIQGCNASFPSKRSRDRHSANTNLHRRLLYSDSIDLVQRWRREGSAGETEASVVMAPIADRKKSLDTALNLTTSGNDQMMEAEVKAQPPDNESTLEVRDEVSDACLNETQVYCETKEETDDFPDNESTVTDQSVRNHSSEAFHASANPCVQNFSARKTRNLLAINENLHNHLLANSTPASAQLAV